MKIIAKKANITNDKYLKNSIKKGLEELREEYLHTWEPKPVTIRGNRNNLEFISNNEPCLNHIKMVLNNYTIPYAEEL